MLNTVLLEDRDGRRWPHAEHWNQYRVPREVWVGALCFRRVGEVDDKPLYREVADGYQCPVGDLQVVITDPTGRVVDMLSVAVPEVPSTLPYRDHTAVFRTIAGPGGRAVYEIPTQQQERP